jgi:hypothetical protein
MTELVGYTAVDTENQSAPLQSDAPKVARCVTISTDVESGHFPAWVDKVGWARSPQLAELRTETEFDVKPAIGRLTGPCRYPPEKSSSCEDASS